MSQFLSVLKQIEDGKLGQHEASVQVGRILKKLYIDSALRKADKLDDKHSKSKGKKKKNMVKNISWNEFKKTM